MEGDEGGRGGRRRQGRGREKGRGSAKNCNTTLNIGKSIRKHLAFHSGAVHDKSGLCGVRGGGCGVWGVPRSSSGLPLHPVLQVARTRPFLSLITVHPLASPREGHTAALRWVMRNWILLVAGWMEWAWLSIQVIMNTVICIVLSLSVYFCYR